MANLSLEEELEDYLGSHIVDEDNSDSDDEIPVGTDQEFSVRPKRNHLKRALEITVVNPDKYIVKLKTSGMEDVILGEIFYQRNYNFETEELFAVNVHVIVKRMDAEGEYTFERGVILSSLTGNQNQEALWKVFLFDAGVIGEYCGFEMSPLPNKFIRNPPPAHVLITIPGLVPRKRMDHVPGLASKNLQDTKWSKGAHEDVKSWLAAHPIRLVYKIKEDPKVPSLWFGDFYGATAESVEPEPCLFSRYLIQQNNSFLNSSILRQVHEPRV